MSLPGREVSPRQTEAQARLSTREQQISTRTTKRNLAEQAHGNKKCQVTGLKPQTLSRNSQQFVYLMQGKQYFPMLLLTGAHTCLVDFSSKYTLILNFTKIIKY